MASEPLTADVDDALISPELAEAAIPILRAYSEGILRRNARDIITIKQLCDMLQLIAKPKEKQKC